MGLMEVIDVKRFMKAAERAVLNGYSKAGSVKNLLVTVGWGILGKTARCASQKHIEYLSFRYV